MRAPGHITGVTVAVASTALGLLLVITSFPGVRHYLKIRKM